MQALDDGRVGGTWYATKRAACHRAHRDFDLCQIVGGELLALEGDGAQPGLRAQLQPLPHMARLAQRARAEDGFAGEPAMAHG